MDRKMKFAIVGGLVVVALLFRFGRNIQIPSFGGGQESGSDAVVIFPEIIGKYIPQVLPPELQGLEFNPAAGMIPQAIVDKYLAGQPGLGINKGSPVRIVAGTAGQSAFAPTFTPIPTIKPTRTPTPIVLRPMTGTATIAFPPASMLVMKGNENSLPVKVRVGGKALSSSYWAKFDGSCGELWCRGPLQVVVPITGTFTLPPTLVVVNGEISYQAANVGSNYDLANLSFDVSLDAPTSKDMKFGDETGVTEFWAVGKNGTDLVLLKVRIQRWDAMNLQFTPLEVVVSFKAGDEEVPGFVKLAVAPTSIPTPTPTATAMQPAARTTPTRTPTRGR